MCEQGKNEQKKVTLTLWKQFGFGWYANVRYTTFLEFRTPLILTVYFGHFDVFAIGKQFVAFYRSNPFALLAASLLTGRPLTDHPTRFTILKTNQSYDI